MPLSQDQIEALLTKKSRRGIKPPPKKTGSGFNAASLYTNGKAAGLSVRRRVGPIQFVNERGQCKSGKFNEELQERFECAVPTYAQFQGVYYCSLHALDLANEMLITKGVLS